MLAPIRHRFLAAFFVVVLIPLLGIGLHGNWITSLVMNRETLEVTILTLALLVGVVLAKPLLQAVAEGFNTMSVMVALQSQLEACLLEKHVRRTAELAALFEVSTEISSQLDLNRVLNLVVDKAHTLLGGEIVVLCLLDEAREKLTMAAASGSIEYIIGDNQATQCGIGAYVVGTGQTAQGCPSNCDCRSH